jgi:hypothetical protein
MDSRVWFASCFTGANEVAILIPNDRLLSDEFTIGIIEGDNTPLLPLQHFV